MRYTSPPSCRKVGHDPTHLPHALAKLCRAVNDSAGQKEEYAQWEDYDLDEVVLVWRGTLGVQVFSASSINNDKALPSISFLISSGFALIGTAPAALQTYALPAKQKEQIENMVRDLAERSKSGNKKTPGASTDSSEEGDDGGEESSEEEDEAEEAEEVEPRQPHDVRTSRSVRGAGGIGGGQQGEGAADAHGGRPTRTRRPPARREDF